MKLSPNLLVAFVLLLTPPVLRAESQKDGQTKPAAADGDKTKQKEDAVLESLPKGQPILGLRVPNFSPSGKLLMLFDAKSAQRVNDRDIELKDLKMEIRNDDGTTFHVSMAHSLFNLDTRILTSDTPTTIRRDDFVITGNRAEFHTKSRFGRMLGATKMVINSENTEKP